MQGLSVNKYNQGSFRIKLYKGLLAFFDYMYYY